MEQETVKDVIKRIIKSMNTIKSNATDIRIVSPEPPLCQGCADGVSICCHACRYREFLKAKQGTAYDNVFPLKVSTIN